SWATASSECHRTSSYCGSTRRGSSTIRTATTSANPRSRREARRQARSRAATFRPGHRFDPERYTSGRDTVKTCGSVKKVRCGAAVLFGFMRALEAPLRSAASPGVFRMHRTHWLVPAFLLSTFFAVQPALAQFGDVGKKLKQKVEQKVEQRFD